MTRPFIPDRAWFERRLDGFGGSEAGALLGISQWQTARDVVNTKARRVIPDPDAPEALRLRLGRDMEPILLEHLWETLVERDGSAPRPRTSRELWRSREHPFVTANVDGFLGDALVELKTDEYGSQPWGPEDGEPATSIPPTYYAQIQHSLVATNRQRALLFVQIGLSRQLLYEVPRRQDVTDALVEVEGVMWRRVELARERLANDPEASLEDLLPPLAGDQLTEHLKAAFPRSTEVIRSATPEQEAMVEELRAAKLAHERATEALAFAAARVQEVIGDAAGLTSPAGQITWRTSKDRVDVAWEQIAAAYRKVARTLVSCVPDANWIELTSAYPELAALWASGDVEQGLDAIRTLYTSTKPGSRVFLTPRAWTK